MRIGQFTIAATLSILALTLSAPNALAQAQAEAMKYCKADVARLCPGVQMGGGRIIACLKEHKMEVSVGCAKVLQAMKAKMGQ
ncbi:MAG: cysteine rich repeat-containing protein [Roseiarcus sp.]|uniref:cysteine rich repeat-containing protein n=1 Tax=Roseiarcus sp. TaxID=1969460 RepID=UPI003C48E452